MITMEHVSKAYGTVQAVADISLAARPGQVFGLIGPNGAGKSTIIRMIMNIIAPDTGVVLFDGRPIAAEDRDRIGYLPEERGLYRKEQVGAVLRYLAELKGCPPTVSMPTIERWLRRFGLIEWKDKPIESLSKGMAQKVQFISCIAHDPDVLFFDEPFSGLDPVSADDLREAIFELGSAGKTVLFSTHVMEHAERVCDQILLINHGREVVQGSVAAVKQQYGSRSVLLEFEGDGAFIRDLPMVADVIEYKGHIEVELVADAVANELLRAVVDRLTIQKFELALPSLHKVFVSLVGRQENT